MTEDTTPDIPAEGSALEEARRLTTLAWPVIIGQIGFILMGVVDLIVVGMLGEGPQASLALGNTWSFGVLIVGMGVLMGLDPVFSQAAGARDKAVMGRTMVQATALGLLLSVPLIVAHLLTTPALTLFEQPLEIIPGAAQYCWAIALGLPGSMVFFALRSFLQGQGIVRPATLVIVVANVLNVIVDVWFTLGGLGLEPMGVFGCGLATSLVRTFMPLALIAVSWSTLRGCWPGLSPAFELGALKGLLLIGLPVGVQVAMEVEAFNFVGLMMGWISPAALAGNAVALNISSLSFMVPFGFSAAAATRVGNLLGAGLPWGRTAWVAIGVGILFMCSSALLFFFAPGAIAGLYTADANVLAVAVGLIPLAACFQLFDGAQVVSFGVLRGAGDTRVPPLFNLLGYWALGIPVGYFLGFKLGWGPEGIWTGLILALMVVSVMLLFRVHVVQRRGGARVVVG